MSVCHLCGRCLWKPEVIVLLELELQTACEPPGLNAGSWSSGRASSAPNHKPGSPSLIPSKGGKREPALQSCPLVTHVITNKFLNQYTPIFCMFLFEILSPPLRNQERII